MKTRASSIWPAAAKAAARVAPPSSRRLVRPRRPSSASAAAIRSVGGRAGGEDRLGAGARAALRAGRVGVGAVDDGQRRLVEGRQELRVERQAGVGVEDDADRLARFADVRAVSSGSSARTVPIPTAIASHSPRQTWTSCAAALAGDPGRGAGRRSRCGRRATSPSSATTSGSPVSACLRKGWLSEAGGAGDLGAGRDEVDLHPAVAQIAPAPGPPPSSLGSSEAITTRARPASSDRVDAGRLAALVGAGLQRHVHRRPGRVLAPLGGVRQRRPLGVQPAELGVEALPDNLPVADDDRADQRIRAHPTAAALGQLERPSQEIQSRLMLLTDQSISRF